MKDYLIKLKLIDYLRVELDIQKNEFIERFSSIVDRGDIGFFSGAFEAFSTSENKFKGQVHNSGFRIRRKRRFFENNSHLAIATGSFKQKNEKLIIDVEINGFHKIMLVFYVFAILIYSLIITSFLSTSNFGNDTFIILPIILIHASLMFGLPYFFMRRSVRKTKYELEREFHFLSK